MKEEVANGFCSLDPIKRAQVCGVSIKAKVAACKSLVFPLVLTSGPSLRARRERLEWSEDFALKMAQAKARTWP